MALAANLKKLLDSYRIPYRVFFHKQTPYLEEAAELLGIPFEQVIASQVLADSNGFLLAAYPLSKQIDFVKILKHLQRSLAMLPELRVNRIFLDCDSGCHVPIGKIYNLDMILDDSIKQHDYIYLSSGSRAALVQLRLEDFLYLNYRANSFKFTLDKEKASFRKSNTNIHKAPNIAMPELPPIALQILRLSMSEVHSTQDLVDLVSQDSGIQQQILNYVRLPFIRASIEAESLDVQNAIQNILGFNTVSHIALGVAASRAFQIRNPCISMSDFWLHSFSAALYAEKITELVPKHFGLDPALSYLSGLFHNFGLLLFSQLFPPEFRLLQKWMRLNPKISVDVLEKRLLGMGGAMHIVTGGHSQLGESLLRHWNLPEAVCVIAKEHHSVRYHGEYSNYVKIIQITNQLLREQGVGDGSIHSGVLKHIDSLELDEKIVRDAVYGLAESSTSLAELAVAMTSK